MEQSDSVWQQTKVSGRLGNRKVCFYETVESTNTLALELGRDGADAGTVVAARTQTKGRGRLGKSWQSPSGTGLYFSVILRPKVARHDLAKITIVSGLAVCKALEQITGVSALIKWPNDVLVGAKKVAGILTESDLSGSGPPLVVLGVGLNVSTTIEDFPVELREKATSVLVATGRNYVKGQLFAALLEKIDGELERFEKKGFSDILAEWRTIDATVGKLLSWVCTDKRIVTGFSLGPDPNGLLQIRDKNGKTHKVLSGDISLAG